MYQASIQQIDNGFLVGTPPTKTEGNGNMIYCANFEEVTAALKRNWPKTTSSSSTTITK